MKDDWQKIPESDPRFPKWLWRFNLAHDFSMDLFIRMACGCVEICLSGIIPTTCHCNRSLT